MKQLFTALIFLFVANVNAQDTVAVSKEPLHKIVFENEYVRLLDLYIAPGDTTLFHKHIFPCVSVSLRPVRTGVQTVLDDKGPRVPSVDRRITFDGFYQSPRIHRVWNRDTSMFHWMDIEVMAKGDRKLDEPIALDGFTQVFDAVPVRAYRLLLKPGQKLEFKRNAPIVVVSMNEARDIKANKKNFSKQGDFLYAKPSENVSLANNGDKEYMFAVLELK